MSDTTALIPVGDVVTIARHVVQSKLYANINSEAQAVTLMLLSQAKGLHPIEAVERYHIIQGRPSMTAQTMLAEFHRGGGKSEILESTTERCRIKLTSPSGGTFESEFNVDMAKRAGLLNKDTWVKHREDMLFNRAVSRGIRKVAPEVIQGIYTPDEVVEFAPVAEKDAIEVEYKELPPDPPKPAAPPAPRLSKEQRKVIRAAFKTAVEYEAAFKSCFGNIETIKTDDLTPEQAAQFIAFIQTPKPAPPAPDPMAEAKSDMLRDLDALRSGDPEGFDAMLIEKFAKNHSELAELPPEKLAAILEGMKP